jgi:hypothetical protein
VPAEFVKRVAESQSSPRFPIRDPSHNKVFFHDTVTHQYGM